MVALARGVIDRVPWQAGNYARRVVIVDAVARPLPADVRGADEGLALVPRTATDGGAEVLGLADYGLAVGCADLVLVDTHVVEAVVAVPARQLVVKAGRIMAVDGAYTS